MYQDDKEADNYNGCDDNSCVDEDYDVGNVEDVNMYQDDKEGDDDKEDVGTENKDEKNYKVDKDDMDDRGKENKDETDDKYDKEGNGNKEDGGTETMDEKD